METENKTILRTEGYSSPDTLTRKRKKSKRENIDSNRNENKQVKGVSGY